MPLNQSLYSRLCAVFGDVRIANQEIEGVAHEVRRPGGGLEFRVPCWGETYKVCCPFCGNRRHRLGVNWRYGLPDPSTEGRFPINYLCKCHNENCVPGNVANRTQLAQQILGFQNVNARRITGRSVCSGHHNSQSSLSKAPPPGELVALANLPLEHPAVEYLMNRGYGVETMQEFGLSFCLQADRQYHMANSRIICPIDFRGVRVGWQARYVGTPPNPRTPKYYTCPGMTKSQILYNFDHARQGPYLVVVEGVTDTWRLGSHAVAVLGHEISSEQQRLLQEFSGGQRPVFLMFDAGEGERICRYTHELGSSGVPVVPVTLPGELDPGDCSQAYLYELITWAANQAGLSFDMGQLCP